MSERERFWVNRGLRETAWSWRVAVLMPLTYVFLGVNSLAKAVQSDGDSRGLAGNYASSGSGSASSEPTEASALSYC